VQNETRAVQQVKLIL